MDLRLLEGFTPLPADYRGWNHDRPTFAALIDQIRPTTIIEVGCWKGMSTITMARKCKDLGLLTTIYCVDTWLGAIEFYTQPNPDRDLCKQFGYPTVYFQFLSNLIHAGVVSMVEPLPLPSNLAYEILPQADLIYIDASHKKEDVIDDIRHYLPLLKPGGVIFGDDYGNPDFPGVKEAADQFNPEVLEDWFWVLRSPRDTALLG